MDNFNTTSGINKVIANKDKYFNFEHISYLNRKEEEKN